MCQQNDDQQVPVNSQGTKPFLNQKTGLISKNIFGKTKKSETSRLMNKLMNSSLLKRGSVDILQNFLEGSFRNLVCF